VLWGVFLTGFVCLNTTFTNKYNIHTRKYKIDKYKQLYKPRSKLIGNYIDNEAWACFLQCKLCSDVNHAKGCPPAEFPSPARKEGANVQVIKHPPLRVCLLLCAAASLVCAWQDLLPERSPNVGVNIRRWLNPFKENEAGRSDACAFFKKSNTPIEACPGFAL